MNGEISLCGYVETGEVTIRRRPGRTDGPGQQPTDHQARTAGSGRPTGRTVTIHSKGTNNSDHNVTNRDYGWTG